MKTKTEIAQSFKNCRLQSGLSTSETVSALEQRNVSISPKTLYGWEKARSQPDINTFLLLCDIYGVYDIASAFGYGTDPSTPLLLPSSPETIHLLERIMKLEETERRLISAYIDGFLDGSRR